MNNQRLPALAFAAVLATASAGARTNLIGLKGGIAIGQAGGKDFNDDRGSKTMLSGDC